MKKHNLHNLPKKKQNPFNFSNLHTYHNYDFYYDFLINDQKLALLKVCVTSTIMLEKNEKQDLLDEFDDVINELKPYLDGYFLNDF